MPNSSRAAILPSQRTDWLTPQPVVDAVVRLYQGQPDLDPAGHRDQLVPARRVVLLPEDGLEVPWRGKVYVNPPYGRGLRAWLAKGRDSFRADSDGTEVAMLVPAATGAEYFHDIVFGSATAVCLWRGRLAFVGGEGGAAFNSAVVYWGRRFLAFRDAFGPEGKVVRL